MANATEKQSLDRLFAELHHLTFASPFTVDAGQLYKVIDAIHKAPQDEKEKLRQKDQTLVNGIEAFRQYLQTQDHMPKGTIVAFLIIVGLLNQIEAILWELKKLPGDPPTPEQPPPPPPTPPPGHPTNPLRV